MKKFIRAVIIILGFVVASSGAIETVNSTVKEFTTEQTQSEQEEQTRDTYEGLIQVGAGSFIMLLTRFLENNKDKVSKYEI
ncbi:MAG: hypothetical protein IAE90_06115, partial [Ignavibacteria bacterium]|nr:hypothetical protein [Ignavibacteria bacterium]